MDSRGNPKRLVMSDAIDGSRAASTSLLSVHYSEEGTEILKLARQVKKGGPSHAVKAETAPYQVAQI